MTEPAHKRQLTSTVYATPLMTPTTALGLSIRLSIFELRETGDWDIFLGPQERARAETGGADQWVLKRRECSGFAMVNKVTSASLEYPLSVFNRNSTLKRKRFDQNTGNAQSRRLSTTTRLVVMGPTQHSRGHE
jgi:hypothetical protein